MQHVRSPARAPRWRECCRCRPRSAPRPPPQSHRRSFRCQGRSSAPLCHYARPGKVTAAEIIASSDGGAKPRSGLALRGYMAQPTASLRIGTRGSPLALVQARMVRARLAAATGGSEDAIELVVIRTTGDVIQDRSLAEEGGKGLFTKEIEEALLDKRVDLAVHSTKDMPTILPDGLVLA